MKFGRKTVKNVSDRFENIIFEKYEPKLTWEQLIIAVVKPEPTFLMGGNNFYFFTPTILDSSVTRWVLLNKQRF